MLVLPPDRGSAFCGVPESSLKFPNHDWKYSYQTLERRAIRASLGLDIGCGSGEKTVIHARFADALVGGDLDTRALKQASTKGIMTVRFDAHALPFRKGAFDLVMCFHTIEHLASPSLFLEEVRRGMAEGSMLIIITPNRQRATSLLNRMLRFIHRNADAFPMNPLHVHEFDLGELKRVASACFEDYYVQPIGLRIWRFDVEFLPRILWKVGDQLAAICRT